MSYEVRKLPKKTIFIIVFMILLALVSFFVLQSLKEQKFTEILYTLGHKNIQKLKVVNKMNVEDIQTKLKSSVYKVVFFDKDLQKTCTGFIHQGKDNKYEKDFDCK